MSLYIKIISSFGAKAAWIQISVKNCEIVQSGS